MPQSSGSSPGRGADHGSSGPTGRSGPPPVRRATSESISIPPARTPPDDHPEDYSPEPPAQPPVDRCDLGPISAPSAQRLWAADDLADLARSSTLFGQDPLGPGSPIGSGWSPGGPHPSCAAPSTHPAALSLTMFGGPPAFAPTAFAPTAAGPAPADAVLPAARPATPGVSDRRQFHRYAGAAMMTAILAEGQIMEVSDVLAASPIQLALERADDMLADLLDAHEATPPAHIFAQTARLRRGLERLGRRSMPAGDARRRDLLTGRVAVLGADAAFKLGDIETARSLTALGFQAGGLAGEGALRGSAREVAAVNEFYAGRPDEALRLARDGLTHVGDGPVRARLTCQVARALAALGDVRGAAQALDQAYDLADLIPPDQWGRPGPSFENFNPVEVSYNATTALCLLGRPQAAQEHAELALPKLDAMNAPGFRSVIRLDLALALARQGRLELERV
ncbi:hypothetical protein, partial [Frankia sp. ACN1ag]|uniref:hypothetical protein n=1 Tax=Frankia sp. ACN1ag TaxID=102891 RepID=UPI001F360F4C